MRKPLIIANWKSNPLTLKEAVVLARSAEKYSKIFRGAQDVFWAEGPYTGEISLRQLKNLGVRYVIVGHSSLRMTLGETDEMVNKKIKAILGGGLSAVLCVGEWKRKGDRIAALVGGASLRPQEFGEIISRALVR